MLRRGIYNTASKREGTEIRPRSSNRNLQPNYRTSFKSRYSFRSTVTHEGAKFKYLKSKVSQDAPLSGISSQSNQLLTPQIVKKKFEKHFPNKICTPLPPNCAKRYITPYPSRMNFNRASILSRYPSRSTATHEATKFKYFKSEVSQDVSPAENSPPLNQIFTPQLVNKKIEKHFPNKMCTPSPPKCAKRYITPYPSRMNFNRASILSRYSSRSTVTHEAAKFKYFKSQVSQDASSSRISSPKNQLLTPLIVSEKSEKHFPNKNITSSPLKCSKHNITSHPSRLKFNKAAIISRYSSRSTVIYDANKFHYKKPQVNQTSFFNGNVSQPEKLLNSPTLIHNFKKIIPTKNYALSRIKYSKLHLNSYCSRRRTMRYSITSKKISACAIQRKSTFNSFYKNPQKKPYVWHTSPLYRNSQCKYKFRRKKYQDYLHNVQRPTESFFKNPYKLMVKRAIETLRYKRKPVCMYFVRTGACPNETSCRFHHDKNYLRICPRFLSRTCPLGEDRCKLAHVLDPSRLPQCEYFAKGDCSRDSCPYLHVHYPPNAVVCPGFMNGRCEYGRQCNKKHIWLAPKRVKEKNRQPRSVLRRASRIQQETSTDVMSQPMTCAPEGSLRDIFPAPSFIPFELN